MSRLMAAAFALLFLIGTVALGSGASARTMQAPARSSIHSLSAHAIAVGHKKKKKKKKHKKSTPTKFDSCSVVTQAQAASAIGASVSAGVLGNATVEGGLACVFYGPYSPTPHTPNVAQADSVRVVVVEGSKALTWYNAYKATVSATEQPISGYGDQAFWDGYASLSVLKGSDYLRIAVSPYAAPPSLSGEEQLATAILPKL
ncbi:MAG: hypothetical protein WBF51_04705 [Candidatus Dormiibacterota bacterium]